MSPIIVKIASAVSFILKFYQQYSDDKASVLEPKKGYSFQKYIFWCFWGFIMDLIQNIWSKLLDFCKIIMKASAYIKFGSLILINSWDISLQTLPQN